MISSHCMHTIKPDRPTDPCQDLFSFSVCAFQSGPVTMLVVWRLRPPRAPHLQSFHRSSKGLRHTAEFYRSRWTPSSQDRPGMNLSAQKEGGQETRRKARTHARMAWRGVAWRESGSETRECNIHCQKSMDGWMDGSRRSNATTKASVLTHLMRFVGLLAFCHCLPRLCNFGSVSCGVVLACFSPPRSIDFEIGEEIRSNSPRSWTRGMPLATNIVVDTLAFSGGRGSRGHGCGRCHRVLSDSMSRAVTKFCPHSRGSCCDAKRLFAGD